MPPSPRAPLPGYEVLAELSRGGMGEVLLGRRVGAHGFERLVAIKTIRAELSGAADVRSMFLDEARLMGRLHHAAIAEVHDFAEHDGTLCLVLEYVRGVPFTRLVALAPPPAVAAQALALALRGLHAAHELCDEAGQPLGVVHRDVSPQNLMLTFEGAVKILDFGIAWVRRRAAPVTELGALKGKPAYMAPEQLGGGVVDRRTDVFAAGLVLHELLTGKKLLEGTPIEIAHALVSGPLAPPSASEPAVPAGIDAVVTRALARDPDERFATAADMAEALERFVASVPADPLEGWARRALEDDRRRDEERVRAALDGQSGAPGEAPPERAGRATGIPTVVGEPVAVTAGHDARRDRRTARVAVAAGLVAAAAVASLLGWRALAGHEQATTAAEATPTELPAATSAPAAASAAAAESTRGAPVGSADIASAPRASASSSRSPPAPPSSPRSSATPAAVAPASAAVAAAMGTLTIGADPYAIVQLDGVSIGPTPVVRRPVAVGPHVIVLLSPDSGAVRATRSVVVEAGANAQVVVR